MMSGRIIRLMVESGMSRKRFAEEVGISAGTLSQWTNGKCNPGADTLLKIADLFDVSVDYLLNRSENQAHDESELVRIYNELDNEGKVIVLASCYKQRQRMMQGR